MLKLSEELEQLSACDDYSNGLYGLPERAAALEIEIDALKDELKATESRLHEIAVGCANAEAELEKAKAKASKAQELADWHLSHRTLAESQLEAAQKQEPAVLIEGKKIFWNPEYKGVHEGGFYASPVPAQQPAAQRGIDLMSDEDIWHVAGLVTRLCNGSLFNISQADLVAEVRASFEDTDTAYSMLFENKKLKGGENER